MEVIFRFSVSVKNRIVVLMKKKNQDACASKRKCYTLATSLQHKAREPPENKGPLNYVTGMCCSKGWKAHLVWAYVGPGIVSKINPKFWFLNRGKEDMLKRLWTASKSPVWGLCLFLRVCGSEDCGPGYIIGGPERAWCLEGPREEILEVWRQRHRSVPPGLRGLWVAAIGI